MLLPTRRNRLPTVAAAATLLLLTPLLALLLTACTSDPQGTAELHPAPTQESPAQGSTSPGSTSPGPTASSAAPRPAAVDLSGISAACKTWKGIDGKSIGMKNPEPADDWTDGYWELMFPGAQVEACQWIDGYPDDPTIDLDPTDIGFSVGAVVGMGLDEYLTSGGDPTWTSEEITVDGYRAVGSLRTTTVRACSVLVDVADGQMLYVAWSRDGEFRSGTTFEQGCADAAGLASLALDTADGA